jgi:predicted deacetylase
MAPTSPRVSRAGRLLLSIHDVSPRSEHAVVRLRELFETRLGKHRHALLVVPDFWGEAPLRADTRFARRLREWAENGDEIFLHGWYHRDEVRHARLLDRLRARWLTAAEGEFLGLDRGEAARRIAAGRQLLEDLTGKPIAGFVAPAWLYGPGARQALADLAVPLAEDHMRVWSPLSGKVLARGPVITWASRSRARIASSLAWAKLARHALQPAHVVRIGVHPGDVGVPAIRDSIAETVGHFGALRELACYGDLLARPPSSPTTTAGVAA